MRWQACHCEIMRDRMRNMRKAFGCGRSHTAIIPTGNRYTRGERRRSAFAASFLFLDRWHCMQS